MSSMESNIGPMALLYEALAKAQGEFGVIAKNREVSIRSAKGNYSFRYADAEEITSKTRPALSKHGLSITQLIRKNDKGTTELVTILAHKGGGTLQSTFDLQVQAADMKELGGRITYLRRYAKSTMLDIAADDDADENGEQAGGQEDQRQDAGEETQQQPEFYPQAKFDANLPAWTDMVTTGAKTAERVLAFIESKHNLTDAQRAAILNIKPAAQSEEQA